MTVQQKQNNINQAILRQVEQKLSVKKNMKQKITNGRQGNNFTQQEKFKKVQSRSRSRSQ